MSKHASVSHVYQNIWWQKQRPLMLSISLAAVVILVSLTLSFSFSLTEASFNSSLRLPTCWLPFLVVSPCCPWVTVILGKPRRYWIGLQREVLGNVSALIRGAKGNKYWHVILFFSPLLYLFPPPLLSLCLFSFIVARGRESVSLGMKMDLNEIFFRFVFLPLSHHHPRSPFLSFSHMESFFSPLWEHCTLSTKANNH